MEAGWASQVTPMLRDTSRACRQVRHAELRLLIRLNCTRMLWVIVTVHTVSPNCSRFGPKNQDSPPRGLSYFPHPAGAAVDLPDSSVVAGGENSQEPYTLLTENQILNHPAKQVRLASPGPEKWSPYGRELIRENQFLNAHHALE